MIIRRRCRRYCLNRTMVLFLTLFSTLSTVTWTYSYFSNLFPDRYTDFDQVYLIDESDLKDAQMPSSRHMHLLSKEFFNTTQLNCQYPKLTLDNEEVWKHLQPVTKSRPDCEKAVNWVYVENGRYSSRASEREREMCFCIHSGTFRLAPQALRKHGAIVCAYRPILRSKDDFSTMEGARLFPIVDRMPLVSDFFRADCRARDGSFYSNIHSGITFDAGLHMRSVNCSDRKDAFMSTDLGTSGIPW